MSDMAKIDVPYVKRYQDRHGKVRYYYRRKGYVQVPLPDPTSPGFSAAYTAAAGKAKPSATSITEGPRSLGALIAQYYLTTEFKDFQPSTQRAYKSVLEQFRAKHGRKLASDLLPKHLYAIFQAMADTPAQASNLRKRLNAVFEIGVALEWLKDNPVTRTKKIKYKIGGHTPWSDADIEAFRAYWPSGSRERLALEILLSAAERRSDAVCLGSQHYNKGHISVVQQKTQERLWIPCHPRLAAEIAQQPKTTTYLMTQYGLPFSPAGFTNWFVERARMAGLLERTPHGLRKAMGRQLAEAGCSSREIGSILGHRSPATSEIYTRDVDQKVLAGEAMKKLAKAEKRTKLSTRSV